MSDPVDPRAVEMWISGLGNILLEQKDAELTALRAEVEKWRDATHSRNKEIIKLCDQRDALRDEVEKWQEAAATLRAYITSAPGEGSGA